LNAADAEPLSSPAKRAKNESPTTKTTATRDKAVTREFSCIVLLFRIHGAEAG
jgi:hypothetical protein